MGSIFLYLVNYQSNNRPFFVIAVISMHVDGISSYLLSWNGVALALMGIADDMLIVLVFGVGMPTGRSIRMLLSFYPLSQSNRTSTGTHIIVYIIY